MARIYFRFYLHAFDGKFVGKFGEEIVMSQGEEAKIPGVGKIVHIRLFFHTFPSFGWGGHLIG